MKKPILSFEDVSVEYISDRATTLALYNFNLDIFENEFICLVGQSGCGKSTALNLAAGLITPSKGIVRMNGDEITGPSKTRAVVFQSDAVFPWMSVEENIAFGPKAQGKSQDEIQSIVNDCLEMIGLTEFRNAWPMSLSGGMRKRVDLARAYASNPKILLMDEPFGALDFLLKEKMQEQLRDNWFKNRKTIFFITHDLEEALFLGSQVIIMTPRPGKIAETVTTNFGEQRLNQLRTEPHFIKMRRELRDLIGLIGDTSHEKIKD